MDAATREPGAAALAEIASGRHRDPFAVLGRHRDGGDWVVRCFLPQAREVALVADGARDAAPMRRIHPAGVFSGKLPGPETVYRLRVEEGRASRDVEDPYRFPSPLGNLDAYLMGEGTHQRLHERLGAHVTELLGVRGVHFAVWAPNAMRVSVVGDFNAWDGRCNVMRFHPGIGVWDIFIPDLGTGALYKYELLDAAGELLPLKADPFALHAEPPPGNASVIYESCYHWQDGEWMAARGRSMGLARPQSTYEVHLGSWRRTGEESRPLSYRELAGELVDYVRHMGFTHLELLPVSEHPFDGSWGYQPIGLYAPTSRFGEPDDLRYLVDRCHQAGLGVVVDWVPGHFPRDPHGLGRFDGTALYEHEDPRQGTHPDWDTLVFNYGRAEVRNYLIGNALYWIDEFHFDALRVDAVASMLYLDYSRRDGEWMPNRYGGKENLEAIDFLRRMNTEVHGRGAVTIAEESTAWPGVSRPAESGGLGFSYKWNMGWMHDTLAYLSRDPVHRKFHHDQMTFGLIYAFDENFVLPLSHDEVVHGKGSLLGRMPGDNWQRFATLRAYYAFMFGYPGKKLLFMGAEFAQECEWNHDHSLDWHLCHDPPHAGVQQLVRDLNTLYRNTPALHEQDFHGSGFEWLDWSDRDNCVFSWLRWDAEGRHVVVVSNFTPVVRPGYRLGVPQGGAYAERINTDAKDYGGSGVGNCSRVHAEPVAHRDRPFSLSLTLPPLSTLILQPAEG